MPSHGFLAGLLGPSSQTPPRVTWHDSAVCLLPAVIPLAFVLTQKPSAAASTTSLSLIGRRKCIEKQIAFPVTGLWLREAAGLSKRTAGVLQGASPYSAPASFPRAFLQAKLQGGSEDSGQWLMERMHFAYFSETWSEVGMNSTRPGGKQLGDLKMLPTFGVKEGKIFRRLHQIS